MSPPKIIRLATASPGTQATTKETLEQIEQLAAQAAANNADILLLPEAYIGGYPRGSDFGCKVGVRTAEGREDFLKYYQQAVDLGDTVGNGAGAGEDWVRRRLPTTARYQGDADEEMDGYETAQVRRGDGTREHLESIARETGVFIVTGLIEKAGGSLYCAVVYADPKLGVIGKRRKVLPTGSERLIWAQGSPATLKAVSTTIRGIRVNLAAAICWENYMPLVRQALYSQNINLYLAPTADNRDAWLSLMRTIALEGRCFVVSSNMCVPGEQKQTAATNGNTVPSNGLAAGSNHMRRSSCFTEEGFEIALPSVPVSPTTTTATISAPAGAKQKKRARRKSVFDEEGNEIVLSGEVETHETVIDEENAGAEKERHQQTVNGHGTTTVDSKTLPAEKTDFLSRGGSCIVAPTGDVVAGPQWEDDSGIIYADVDLEDCIRGRLDLDVAGSYSRNDSFKFSVDGLPLDPLPY